MKAFLCALLCVLAGANAAQEPAGLGLTEDEAALRNELEPSAKKLSDWTVELEKLRQSYTGRKELGSIEARRRELRDAMESELDEFSRLSEDFNVMTKTRYVRDLAGLLSGREKHDVGAKIAGAVGADDYKRLIRAVGGSAKETLLREQEAYAEAQARLHREFILYRVLPACLALLLLGGAAAGYWIRRRLLALSGSGGTLSGRIVTDVPGPTGAVSGPAGGYVSGPVSGPAGGRLSGPASPGPVPGTVLGENFRIERQIGEGGMGVVYEATDTALERKIAIKRMRSEVTENKKELDMFLAEARLVAALKHPNLVEIFHIFGEGTNLYLVFEFIEGKTLEAHLEAGKPFPPKYAASFLRQAAQGLDYAHSRKVIHRDLKPANIMLSAAGLVKIMDFGIAHQAKKTVARITKADAWGTPPYMAPEQEVGTVSRESDLYALGACAYEMLTGVPAFDGPNFLAQKREMRFAPPTRVVAGLPGGLDAVLRRVLDADPAKRFHSGAEFYNAFAAAL